MMSVVVLLMTVTGVAHSLAFNFGPPNLDVYHDTSQGLKNVSIAVRVDPNNPTVIHINAPTGTGDLYSRVVRGSCDPPRPWTHLTGGAEQARVCQFRSDKETITWANHWNVPYASVGFSPSGRVWINGFNMSQRVDVYSSTIPLGSNLSESLHSLDTAPGLTSVGNANGYAEDFRDVLDCGLMTATHSSKVISYQKDGSPKPLFAMSGHVCSHFGGSDSFLVESVQDSFYQRIPGFAVYSPLHPSGSGELWTAIWSSDPFNASNSDSEVALNFTSDSTTLSSSQPFEYVGSSASPEALLFETVSQQCVRSSVASVGSGPCSDGHIEQPMFPPNRSTLSRSSTPIGAGSFQGGSYKLCSSLPGDLFQCEFDDYIYWTPSAPARPSKTHSISVISAPCSNAAVGSFHGIRSVRRKSTGGKVIGKGRHFHVLPGQYVVAAGVELLSSSTYTLPNGDSRRIGYSAIAIPGSNSTDDHTVMSTVLAVAGANLALSVLRYIAYACYVAHSTWRCLGCLSRCCWWAFPWSLSVVGYVSLVISVMIGLICFPTLLVLQIFLHEPIHPAIYYPSLAVSLFFFVYLWFQCMRSSAFKDGRPLVQGAFFSKEGHARWLKKNSGSKRRGFPLTLFPRSYHTYMAYSYDRHYERTETSMPEEEVPKVYVRSHDLAPTNDDVPKTAPPPAQHPPSRQTSARDIFRHNPRGGGKASPLSAVGLALLICLFAVPAEARLLTTEEVSTMSDPSVDCVALTVESIEVRSLLVNASGHLVDVELPSGEGCAYLTVVNGGLAVGFVIFSFSPVYSSSRITDSYFTPDLRNAKILVAQSCPETDSDLGYPSMSLSLFQRDESAFVHETTWPMPNIQGAQIPNSYSSDRMFAGAGCDFIRSNNLKVCPNGEALNVATMLRGTCPGSGQSGLAVCVIECEGESVDINYVGRVSSTLNPQNRDVRAWIKRGASEAIPISDLVSRTTEWGWTQAESVVVRNPNGTIRFHLPSEFAERGIPATSAQSGTIQLNGMAAVIGLKSFPNISIPDHNPSFRSGDYWADSSWSGSASALSDICRCENTVSQSRTTVVDMSETVSKETFPVLMESNSIGTSSVFSDYEAEFIAEYSLPAEWQRLIETAPPEHSENSVYSGHLCHIGNIPYLQAPTSDSQNPDAPMACTPGTGSDVVKVISASKLEESYDREYYYVHTLPHDSSFLNNLFTSEGLPPYNRTLHEYESLFPMTQKPCSLTSYLPHSFSTGAIGNHDDCAFDGACHPSCCNPYRVFRGLSFLHPPTACPSVKWFSSGSEHAASDRSYIKSTHNSTTSHVSFLLSAGIAAGAADCSPYDASLTYLPSGEHAVIFIQWKFRQRSGLLKIAVESTPLGAKLCSTGRATFKVPIDRVNSITLLGTTTTIHIHDVREASGTSSTIVHQSRVTSTVVTAPDDVKVVSMEATLGDFDFPSMSWWSHALNHPFGLFSLKTIGEKILMGLLILFVAALTVYALWSCATAFVKYRVNKRKGKEDNRKV